MREIRTSGSVGGAHGDMCAYPIATSPIDPEFDILLSRSLDDFRALIKTLVSGIAINNVVVIPNELVGHSDITDVCRSGNKRVDIATECTHANVRLHAEIVLIPLLRLVHLGIPCPCAVLR